jgi:ABC-2 type transport system permease protein
MKRVFSQCVKELSQFWRDRITVALAFILPLAVLLIYGYAIRLEAKNIPISIQDFDNSLLSRTYVEQIFATNQFVPTPLLNGNPTLAIDRGVAKAAIIIPPEFSRSIHQQKSVLVQVLVDGTDVNNARVIQNSIRATTQFFLSSNQLIPNQPQAQVVTNIRLWFNPGREEALYIVPGIFGVILWVFPSMLAAIALVREKEQGTIVQIYASDLSATEWLLGKELAYFIVGVGEAVLTLTVAAVLFGIRVQGDPSPLIVGTTVFLAAAVAFGLFVGTRASNQTGAVQGTAIVGFLQHYCFLASFTASKIFPSPCHCFPTLFRLATTSPLPAMRWCGVLAGRALATRLWSLPFWVDCSSCWQPEFSAECSF